MSSSSTKPQSALTLEFLESRVLYSADLFGGLLLPDAETSDADSTETDLQDLLLPATPAQTDQLTELVIVDGSYESLSELYELLQQQPPDERLVEYVLFNQQESSTESLQQITEIIARYENLGALHLLTHASDGELLLGEIAFGLADLSANHGLIEQWAGSLAEGADILLYGCDLAAASEGKILAEEIARMTSADVAASTDLTGHEDLNADWELEYQVGDVDTSSIVSESIGQGWRGTLDITSNLRHHWALDGNGINAVGSSDLVLQNSTGFTTGIHADGLQLDADGAVPFAAEAPYNFGVADAWAGLGNDQFTVAFWINPANVAQDAYVIGDYINGANAGIEFLLRPGGILEINAIAGGNSDQLISTAALAQNAWTLVSLTRIDNEWVLYQSDPAGISSTTTLVSVSFAAWITGQAPLFIGAAHDSSREFDGVMDEIRIYDRALSAGDIHELAQFAPTPATVTNNAPVAAPGPLISLQLEDVLNDGGLDLNFVGLSAMDTDPGSSTSGYAIDIDLSGTTQGHYEYTTDAGANWFDVGTVSSSAALVLPNDVGSTFLRFVPAFDFNGSAAPLAMHVLDDTYSGSFTSGAARATTDTSSGGGQSPISAGPTVLRYDVEAAADATDFTALPDVLTERLDAVVAQPDDLAHGDFDGDGDQDLVVTSSAGNGVYIVWNDGANSLQTLATPVSPVKPQVIDYDGDGDLDIAVLSQTVSGNDALLYKNNGTGNFTIQTLDAGIDNAADLEFAHISGDLLLDLILSDPGSGQLVYFRQFATGDFSGPALPLPSQTGNAFNGASELASADVNGDGDIDLFLSIPGSGQIVRLETDALTGTNTQTLIPADPTIHSLELGDLNGDGLLDIVWGGDELVWMERNSSDTGYISYRIDTGLGTNWKSSVFDQNNDGSLDVVAVDEISGEVTVYRNDGFGVFGQVPVSIALGPASSVDFVDIDGDSRAEMLIATAGSVEVARNIAGEEYVRLETNFNTAIAIPAIMGEDSEIPAGNLEVTVTSSNGKIEFANSAGLSFTTGSAAADFTKVFTATVADANAALSSMTYTPFTGFSGFARVQVSFEDTSAGQANPKIANEVFAIEVLPNARPVIAAATLPDIPEDTSNAPGAEIGSLFDPGFTDADAGDYLAGVMVLDLPAGTYPSADGSWQYRADGSSTWKDVNFYSGYAQVLDRSTWLRFQPAEDFSGSAPTLWVTGVDSTYQGSLSTANSSAYISPTSSAHSGSSSILPARLDTNVTPINDSPVSQAATLAGVFEDDTNPPGIPIPILFGDNFVDPDPGDQFAAIAIVENTADPVIHGSWQYTTDNGSSWFDVGSVSVLSALMIESTERLRFLPAPDFFGTPPDIRLHVLDSTYTGGFSSGPSRVVEDVSVNGGSTPISDISHFLRTGILGVNDAPVAVADNFGINEGETLTGNASWNDVDIDNDTLNASILSGTTYGTVSILADGAFTYIHDGSETTADSFTYRQTDPSGTFSDAIVNITIVPANDAPVIQSAALAGVAEDSINPPGNTVNALFGANYIDPDPGAQFSGIAISANTANAATEGSWQYSSDAGATWFDVDSIAAPGALILSATDKLRFMPVANYNGVPANLLLHALDDTYNGLFTSGATRQSIADIAVSGGNTAVSGSAVSLSTAVNPVNDVPVGMDDNVTVFEGGTVTGNVSANDFDIDGDSLTANLLTLPSSGAINLQADGTFFYIHDGSNTTSDSFTYRQTDPSGAFADSIVNITITGVNDAPLIQSAALAGVPEDSTNPVGNTINALFGAGFSDSDPGAQFGGIAISANTVNAAGEGSWQYSTDAGVNWFDVGSITAPGALVIGAADKLRFLPVANYNGVPADLVLHGLDDTYAGLFTTGATRQLIADVSINGASTAISDTAVTLSTAVNPVNDAPIPADDSFTMFEGGTLMGDVSTNDVDIDGDSLTATLLGSPVSGTVTLQADGTFAYNHNGSNTTSDSFTYRQTDPSGTFSNNIVNILIAGVNDAPTLQNAALAGIIEDNTNPPGSTVSALFGANFSDPDPGAQLSAVAIAGNTANAVTEGSWQYSTDAGATWFDVGSISAPEALVISATDKLRFLPVANYNGVPANLLLHGLDDTYTGLFTSNATRQLVADVSVNGGSTAISATAVTLSTAINPVNDAPLAVADSVSTVEGGTVVGDVSTNDSDVEGDSLSAGLLTNPLSGTVNMQANGTFTYIHDGSNTTSDSFTYRQTDSTGASSDSIVNISIGAVNDAPAIQSAALAGVAEDSTNPVGNTVSALFGNGFADADAGAQFTGIAVSANTANSATEGSWQYSTDAGATWFDVGGIAAPGALVLSPTDMLRFVPAADYNGVPPDLRLHGLDDTYTGLVSSGATRQMLADVSLNGGSTAISDSAVTLSTAVNPVNDSPVAVADSYSVTEGGTVSGDVTGNDTDIDNATLTVSVVTGPANGNVTMASNGQFTYVHDASNTLIDSFSYIATDANGATDTAVVSITVMSVNDPPTVDLANQALQLAENTTLGSMGSGIKVADIVVIDDNLGSNQLSLSGADAAMFQLVGNSLHLAPAAVLDFETRPQLSVIVNVEDASFGVGINDSTAFQLQITDANEPASIALANPVLSLAENTATSAPIPVADIVVTDDIPGVNQLQLTGTDAAMFQIVGNQLQLVAGAVLDFESQSTLSVTINMEDPTLGLGVNDSVTHTVQISDFNEPPSITLPNALATLSESTAVTSPLKVAEIVVTDDATGTNNLVLSAADAALFQIIGNELYLSAGFVADFETLPQLSVVVSVDDPQIGTAAEDATAYTLQILDANEPPALSLANTLTSLPETSDTSAAIKIADIVVTDDAQGTNVLALSGTDAADFQIVGNELLLAPGAVIDFETNSQLDLNVSVDDPLIGTGADAVVSHTISITDSNEAPSVWLINTLTTLPEDTDVSSPVRVADIVVTDDSVGTNELSLSGPDAAIFEIIGNGLFLSAGATLDFETLAQLAVSLSVDDPQIGTGAESGTGHTLDILDSNEPPAVWLINTLPSLPENANTSSAVKVADIVLVDDALGTVDLQLTGADAGLFQIVGNELFLVAGAALDHEVQATLLFSITVDDVAIGTTVEDSDSAAIAITDFSEAPQLLSIEPGAAVFVENDVPVAISETLLALAPQSGSLSSATVAISAGFQPLQDQLIVNDILLGSAGNAGSNPLVADYNAMTGVLTISGQGTTADYLQWLRSIEYVNSSEDPVADSRTVEITVVDAGLASNTVQREITVVPVNDAPVSIEVAAITLTTGESVELSSTELLTVDADHSSQDIVYSVIEPPAGLEIVLHGQAVSVFSQSDIDAGLVSFIHDGSDANGGNLFLEVTDGLGGMSGITLPVFVLPAEPQLGAALIEVTEPEIVPEPAPIAIEAEFFEPVELLSTDTNTIDNILEEFGVANNEEEDSLTETLGATADAPAATTENFIDEGTVEQTVASGEAEADVVDGEFEMLVSLRLPTLPFRVDLFQQAPLVNDITDVIFERPATDELTVELRDQVLASLLELNPVKVAVNSQEWIDWQSENGGFERSLEVLDEVFKEAADDIEREGVVPDLVIGTSIGLTTGFLVWLLRGGTLLASLMSVAPLWKQFDPLPILTTDLDGSSSEGDDDDEVESLFKAKGAKARRDFMSGPQE